MEFCEKCSQEIVGKYAFNNDKPELKGKKFCSMVCMEKYYNEHKSSSEKGEVQTSIEKTIKVE
jgi:hypothetical protein